MTKAFSETPLWPYVGVVGCLLILTILAPRTWQPVQRSRPVDGEIQEPEPDTAEVAIVARPDATPTPTPAQAQRVPALEAMQSPRQEVATEPRVAKRFVPQTVEPKLPVIPAPESTPELPQVAAAPRFSPPPVKIEATPVVMVRQESEVAPRVATAWPIPADLVRKLDELNEHPSCAAWVARTRFTLEQLHQTESLTDGKVPQFLDNLEGGVVEAQQLARQADSAALRTKILWARHALLRRVTIWQQVRQAALGSTTPVAIVSPDDSQLRRQLSAIEQQVELTRHADQWRSYLLLDELRQQLESGNTAERRQVARKILSRLESPRLDQRQRELLSQSPFAELSRELRAWANEPIDYLALLDDLEAFEENGRTNSARALARYYQAMRWSSNPAIAQLGRALDVHYRNANVRLAVSGQLVNRLLPDIDATDEEIQESIAGAWVSGTSRTETELRAVLIPDNTHWRIGVEASGAVESETAANAGAATFYNDALSHYLARKLLLVDPNGVRVWRAEAEADSEADLTGVRTDFDRVPIIGWLARSIAIDEHNSRFPWARRAAEERLAAHASARLDKEVHERLIEADEEFDKYLYEPMKKLKLNPVALDLHTTEERLVGRYRLAGSQQLGAYTPRPRAPGDSLLSVQIHESAMNNILEQLKLEGQKTELRQLFRDLAATFARPDLEIPDDIPDNVTVKFATQEAIRVRCADGRVTVTMRIAELRADSRNKWRNFIVRAYYVPDSTQLHANLVRDGIIELAGRRITSRDRIALSGIFNKVLSRSQPFNLVNEQLAESPNLQDLTVTQFVINEGWIGVALGKQRGATLTPLASLQRPMRSRLRR